MSSRQKLYSHGGEPPLHKSSRKDHSSRDMYMPSFSSTLLDEIYRSIDGNDASPEPFMAYKEKPLKRQGGFKAKSNACAVEDKGIADFRRACLVESWMRKEDTNRSVAAKGRPPLVFPEMETKSLQDNDLLFFSSTSTSSDSSGALSSSDTEFFGSTTKAKVSCFTTRPKPVRTGGSARKKDDCSFFDDYQNHQKNGVQDDDLIKSKSRALKIYANLKKMKQPISPGGRLTTFINSLFSNANGKKSSKNNGEPYKGFYNSKSPKEASSSTCSSASSFSRSCLSKSRVKMREGSQRTVRFDPVSVIVDEDSRPCGHKSIKDEHGRAPLPPKEMSKREKNRKLEEASMNALKSYYSKRGGDDLKKILVENEYDGDDIDDRESDSSSDLFELDHLALFGDSRFCQELPVYETTHFDKNRGLIC